MSVASRIRKYMSARGVSWDPVPHDPSATTVDAAHAALLSESRVAKAVVLEDEAGYVLAVIGANHSLDVSALSDALGRRLQLAAEPELDALFDDCEPGAVPAIGPAYGIPTVWDDSLGERRDVYFEGGDHRTLVHLSGSDFGKLMRNAWPLRYYLH